jgi:hypothetical protein
MPARALRKPARAVEIGAALKAGAAMKVGVAIGIAIVSVTATAALYQAL